MSCATETVIEDSQRATKIHIFVPCMDRIGPRRARAHGRTVYRMVDSLNLPSFEASRRACPVSLQKLMLN